MKERGNFTGEKIKMPLIFSSTHLAEFDFYLFYLIDPVNLVLSFFLPFK